MTRYTLRVSNKVYDVGSHETSIGRAPDNQVVLSDPMVSSHHAAVNLRNGHVVIHDLGSTNGTFVNQALVNQRQYLPIGDSDQVRLGDSIDILGFPDVGGATVTLTKGTVAGFIEDDSGRARGWIKTDAEISPGNSGGVAINLAGELIGVPSLVSSEDRTLGRIGVLRPVKLARSILLRVPKKT